MFEALLADDACSRTAGPASDSPSRPIRSAPCRCANGWRTARAHRRKLMVRLVKGAYWDTEIKAAQVAGLPDYPVFTRKVATDVSYIACAKIAARGERTSSTRRSRPTTPTRLGRSRRSRARRRSNSSACTAWARGFTRSSASSNKAIGDTADAGAHLCAGRQPQGAARLSRPPAARERRQFLLRQPHRRRPCRRSTSWCGIRLPSSTLYRAQAQSGDSACRGDLRRRRAATAPASIVSDPLVREPLLKRLKALEARSWTAQPRRGAKGGKGRAVDFAPRSPDPGRHGVSMRPRDDVDRMVAPRHAAQPTGMRLAARLGPRCSIARPTCSKSIAKSSSRCASARAGRPCSTRCSRCARRSISCAIYASEARRQVRAAANPLPGPTGEQNELRLHGRGVFAGISARGISRWRSSRAWSSAPLAAGNSVIAKPAGQTPLIGALAIELMHEAGIPERRRPARAGRRQGRRWRR